MDDFSNKLKKCMENIKLSSGVEYRILHTNYEDDTWKNNVNMYQKRLNKKIMIKYAVSFAVAMLVCITISSAGIYAFSGRSLWDIFFNEEGHQHTEELLDYNGQSFMIDGYTITLEQTLYDSKTSIGYLVFAITKENGTPEIELNKWNQAVSDCFGVGGRFNIDLVATGGQTETFEVIGDTLYEYFSFTTNEEFDGKVDLVDYNQVEEGTIDGYKRFQFSLKETSKVKEYVIDASVSVAISPLGLAIDTSKELEAACIVLCYKDGREEIILDTSNSKHGMDEMQEIYIDGKIRYQYIFGNILDIGEIDCIEFDDIQKNE